MSKWKSLERWKIITLRGTLKGMFELHFKIELDKKVAITRSLCEKWNDVCAQAILSEKCGESDLKELFAKHFQGTWEPGADEFELSKQWELWEEKENPYPPDSNTGEGHN